MSMETIRRKAAATRRARTAQHFSVNGVLPTRAIPNRSGHCIRGGEFSVKMGCHIVWESPYELAHIAGLDVSPEVRAFYPQPKAIPVVGPDGRPHSYTADFRVETYDGRTILHEVGEEEDKKRKKPFYDAVQRACLNLGFGFEMVYAHHITREPFYSNAKLLVHCRNVNVDEGAVVRAVLHLARSKERFTLGDLALSFGGWKSSKLIVLALCLHGYVDADLESCELCSGTTARVGMRVGELF